MKQRSGCLLILTCRHWRVADSRPADKQRVTPVRLFAAVIGLFSILISVSALFAGPPFRTDDPEPVEYRHWEFYFATQYANDKDGLSGTAPHLELNYGIAPNVQLHLIAPAAFDKPRGGPTLYGPGDLELGVKYRFIQEGEYSPMVGTFPILHLPTGNQNRGLGNGDPSCSSLSGFKKAGGPRRATAAVTGSTPGLTIRTTGMRAGRSSVKWQNGLRSVERYFIRPRPRGMENIKPGTTWEPSSTLPITIILYSQQAQTFAAPTSSPFMQRTC